MRKRISSETVSPLCPLERPQLHLNQFSFLLFLSTSTSNLLVYLGRENQQSLNPNEVSRTVSRVILHPDYNPSTFNNDIALLQLSSAVTFTNYIRPVCLAAAGSVFSAGTSCWVTGWGTIRTDGEKLFALFFVFSSVLNTASQTPVVEKGNKMKSLGKQEIRH